MAVNSKKIKLKTVLMNNRKWPLIIVGGVATDFNAPILPATISPRDLNICDWVTELVAMNTDQMVIDGLDKLRVSDQQKFITLLKDRRAGLHKLPDNIQIIIPVKFVDKLDKKIKELALVYNV